MLSACVKIPYTTIQWFKWSTRTVESNCHRALLNQMFGWLQRIRNKIYFMSLIIKGETKTPLLFTTSWITHSLVLLPRIVHYPEHTNDLSFPNWKLKMCEMKSKWSYNFPASICTIPITTNELCTNTCTITIAIAIIRTNIPRFQKMQNGIRCVNTTIELVSGRKSWDITVVPPLHQPNEDRAYSCVHIEIHAHATQVHMICTNFLIFAPCILCMPRCGALQSVSFVEIFLKIPTIFTCFIAVWRFFAFHIICAHIRA